MADVVQEGGEDRNFGAIRVEGLPNAGDFALDDLNQLARGMKDADAMGEARMGRAREHEIRRPELLDAAQALELRGVEQTPRELIEPASPCER